VFRFLGVDEEFHSTRFTIERHRSRRKRRLTPSGHALRAGAVGSIIRSAPSSWTGYLEWMLLFPFSRPEHWAPPSPELRSQLDDMFHDELALLSEEWEIAEPIGPLDDRD
jgi:hypothetical protein